MTHRPLPQTFRAGYASPELCRVALLSVCKSSLKPTRLSRHSCFLLQRTRPTLPTILTPHLMVKSPLVQPRVGEETSELQFYRLLAPVLGSPPLARCYAAHRHRRKSSWHCRARRLAVLSRPSSVAHTAIAESMSRGRRCARSSSRAVIVSTRVERLLQTCASSTIVSGWYCGQPACEG